MVVKEVFDHDKVITEKDREMIAEAKKYPVEFDEDSPEMTPEMEKAFRVAANARDRLRA